MALPSHPNNVPSADFSLYVERLTPINNTISVYIGDQSSTRTMDAPLAYWKWPGTTETSASHRLQSSANPATNEVSEEHSILLSRDLSVKANDLNGLTLKNVPVRIQKHPTPPHINWIQRVSDIRVLQNQEEMAKQARKQEFAELERQHAKIVKEKSEQALRAAALDIAIDHKDGFIKVRGTRKRAGAGMDLEIGRIRRKYMYVPSYYPIASLLLHRPPGY